MCSEYFLLQKQMELKGVLLIPCKLKYAQRFLGNYRIIGP